MHDEPVFMTSDQVKAFDRCPRQFGLERYGEPWRPGALSVEELTYLAERRTIAHFLSVGGWQRCRPEFFARSFLRGWRTGDFPGILEEIDAFEASMRRLNRFYCMAYLIGSEELFQGSLDCQWVRRANMRMITRFDRVCRLSDGTLQVVRYPMAGTPGAEIDSDTLDFVFQHLVVAAIYEEHRPKAIRVTADCLDTCVKWSRRFSPDELEEHLQDLRQQASDIRAACLAMESGATLQQAFPANPTAHCMDCPVRYQCDEGQSYAPGPSPRLEGPFPS